MIGAADLAAVMRDMAAKSRSLTERSRKSLAAYRKEKGTTMIEIKLTTAEWHNLMKALGTIHMAVDIFADPELGNDKEMLCDMVRRNAETAMALLREIGERRA